MGVGGCRGRVCAGEAVRGGECGKAGRLSREQKGRFVATCWTAQMYKHFEEPKPGYVADWSELPEWQRETDADIFEAIERQFPLS